MKVPIRKNLSDAADGLMGYLEIPQDVADTMATCYSNGLGFKIDACCGQSEGVWRMLHVAISGIPIEPSINKPLKGSPTRAQHQLLRLLAMVDPKMADEAAEAAKEIMPLLTERTEEK